MFKRLRNNNGIIPTCFFGYAFGAMVIATIVLTPSHRARKTVEKCNQLGMTVEQCDVKLQEVKSGDISFIRDI